MLQKCKKCKKSWLRNNNINNDINFSQIKFKIKILNYLNK